VGSSGNKEEEYQVPSRVFNYLRNDRLKWDAGLEKGAKRLNRQERLSLKQIEDTHIEKTL
jgi:hypothetical protein